MTLARGTRWTVEVAVAACGGALVVSAALATQAWLDRHFLPSFLMSRTWYVGIETASRIAVLAIGITLVAASRRIAAWLRALGVRYGLRLVAAALLAFAASDIALHRVHLGPAEWRILDEEPRRKADAEIGWTFAANRTGYGKSGGRTIQYTFDTSGYRVRAVGDSVNRDRPSVLFAGESVMFGDGLTYDESVPAQAGTTLGLQPVNMAVYGFSTDQTYLNIRRELPRFSQPRAVVALFMTTLFGRNLDSDRPHLTSGLVWQPARERGRLATLVGLFFPFRRDATVERGITVTREVMVAIASLARARHAVPLIVVPQVGVESTPERWLRQQILDPAAVPYVLVPLDPAWHIRGDHHPDARAAHVIAEAIAAALSNLELRTKN
jgi:hypothetical protein